MLQYATSEFFYNIIELWGGQQAQIIIQSRVFVSVLKGAFQLLQTDSSIRNDTPLFSSKVLPLKPSPVYAKCDRKKKEILNIPDTFTNIKTN